MPLYQSLFDANLGNEPDVSPSAWSTTVTANVSTGWRQLVGAQVQSIDIVYPVGSGPASDVTSLNVYLLPNGFLREASQYPPGGPTMVGGPGAIFLNDWQYEGDFIVTSQSYPIVLRFVADQTDVGSMDPMFCEGMAARMASEVVETLTQSTAKLAAINAAYKLVMKEARNVNGIEVGYQDPPEDDYIMVRY